MVLSVGRTHPSAFRVLLLLTLANTAAPGVVRSQTRELDRSAPIVFEIRLNPVGRIPASDTDLLPTIFLDLDRAPGGRFVVCLAAPGLPLVFDSAGVFLQHLPPAGDSARFRASRAELIGGDSLLVFDGASRTTRLYDANLSLAWTHPSPFDQVFDVKDLGDHRMVVAGASGTAERVGYPLHLWDRSVDATPQPFGSEQGELWLHQGHLLRRVLSGQREGLYWAAHESEYRLEQYDARGNLKAILYSRPPWFSDPTIQMAGNPSAPPSPIIRSIHQDASGRLWVALWVPADNWREAWNDIEILPDGHARGRMPYDWLFDTLLEVIDPVSARVLASTKVDPLVHLFLEDGLLASFSQTGSDSGFIRVWRPEIIPNPPEKTP